MSDHKELYKALREKQKDEKRARAQEAIDRLTALRDRGLLRFRKTTTAGLRVWVIERGIGVTQMVDFWPTTGNWKPVHPRGRTTNGLDLMLRHLGVSDG